MLKEYSKTPYKQAWAGGRARPDKIRRTMRPRRMLAQRPLTQLRHERTNKGHGCGPPCTSNNRPFSHCDQAADDAPRQPRASSLETHRSTAHLPLRSHSNFRLRRTASCEDDLEVCGGPHRAVIRQICVEEFAVNRIAVHCAQERHLMRQPEQACFDCCSDCGTPRRRQQRFNVNSLARSIALQVTEVTVAEFAVHRTRRPSAH